MADNTNRLELVISVKDDGSIVIDTVKKKTDDLGQTTEQASAKGESGLKAMKASWIELAAGVTAGYFTIKKGIDIITGLVNVVAEAEQIEKRAAFQIETWGYKFQEIKPYVDAFAESIQRTTRFSGEMALQGLGQIMQYTSSVEKGMKGVQLAMNMTTQTGQDLGSTLRLVGMAMHGNVEMLGRWIPELRDLESKLGANASEAEKASFAIEILNKKFSGAAQADLNTYAGQVSNLKNQWDDLKKSIGTTLMPSAENWVAGMKLIVGNFAESVKPTIEKFKKEQKNLEDWLSYGGQGASAKYVEDYKRRIDEVKNKIKQLEGTTAAAAAAQKKATEQPKMAGDIQDVEILTSAYEKLGFKSTDILSKEAMNAIKYAEVIKKAFEEKKASVRDYVNALNVASDAMKKLTGEEVGNKLADLESDYQKRVREISPEDPDRQKRVQAIIDDYFKARKEIEKMKIPVNADVAPAEIELNKLQKRAEQMGLTLKVIPEGEKEKIEIFMDGILYKYSDIKDKIKSDPILPKIDGTKIEIEMDGILYKYNEIKNEIERSSIKIKTEGTSSGGGGGANVWGIPIGDFFGEGGAEGSANIGFFGIGSSRKPISEKIAEIIGEFGGLDKAMSGLEAEINVAELSAQYDKLNAKLSQVERIIPDMSAMASWAGGSPYVGGPIIQTVTDLMADLMSQMKILQMKMDYERLKMYGGSYQAGTSYVPQTGMYMLHEGEKVTTRNQISMGAMTVNFEIRSTDPKETANAVVKALKYHLHGELRDLIG
jgi:hypothetical protein